MKTTLISTVLTLFATFTTTTAAPAHTTHSNETTPGVASFKLKADSSAPTWLAGSILKWDGKVDGNLGFTNHSGVKEFSGFIQHNKTHGPVLYARNTALQMYLRPTHGTPSYFAKLGDPDHDAAPALTLSTNFTVDARASEPGEVEYVFGYSGNNGLWSACGGKEGYALYFGAIAASRYGCTEEFGLDLVYE